MRGNDCTIKILPEAFNDIKEAKKWYETKKKGLGLDFKESTKAHIDYIAQNPLHFQKRYKELRLSLVPRFPYAIFYKFRLSKKQIVIFAILHTKRDPEIVRNRIKN